MEDRTKIINPERMKQVIEFTGLQYGTITPTDFDIVIELNDQAWIISEIKHGTKKLPYGQRLALQRAIQDFISTEKKAVAIVAEHYIDDVSQPIVAAECTVREFFPYNTLRWHQAKNNLTLKDCIDYFMEKFGHKKETA